MFSFGHSACISICLDHSGVAEGQCEVGQRLPSTERFQHRGHPALGVCKVACLSACLHHSVVADRIVFSSSKAPGGYCQVSVMIGVRRGREPKPFSYKTSVEGEVVVELGL